MVFATTLAARLVLGVFFAGLVGFSAYMLGNFIILSFGAQVTDILLLVSWAVGGGVGGFLGWMAPHGEWRENLIAFGLALVGASAGVVVGLQLVNIASTPGEPIQVGTGIPRLAGMLSGATIGSNVLPPFQMVYRRMRGTRL